MTPCYFEFPCRPCETVYMPTHDGVLELYVTQFQIGIDSEGNLQAVICFPNFPYMPLEEASECLYGTFEEAWDIYLKAQESCKEKGESCSQ